MNLPPLTETNIQRIVATIRDLARGATNALGREDVVLTAGTETRIETPDSTPGALVTFAPLDAAAAAAGIFQQEAARGYFVFGHRSGPEGRRVRYEIRRP